MKMPPTAGRPARGFALVGFSLALLLILGCVGLAFDIGRMYIARNEAQSYVDSAAIAATLQLDGTTIGISRATTSALNAPKGWDFGTRPFQQTQVSFGPSPAECASNPDSTRAVCACVVTRVSLPMFFLPVVGASFQASIAASAAAKQIRLTTKENLFPLSPYAHPYPNTPPADPPLVPEPALPDPYNFIPALYSGADGQRHLRHGGRYTLRWAATAEKNVCPGDQDDLVVAIGKQTGDERGYIWQSGSNIRDTIVNDSIPPGETPVTEGGTLNMTGGAKDTEVISAIAARSGQDTDTVSQWYQDYLTNLESSSPEYTPGNGRRIVYVPINSGTCGALAYKGGAYTNPCSISYEVRGFAAFFLMRPDDYDKGGIKASCAEYIGAGVPSPHGGAVGGPGAYTVRLVR